MNHFLSLLAPIPMFIFLSLSLSLCLPSSAIISISKARSLYCRGLYANASRLKNLPILPEWCSGPMRPKARGLAQPEKKHGSTRVPGHAFLAWQAGGSPGPSHIKSHLLHYGMSMVLVAEGPGGMAALTAAKVFSLYFISCENHYT